MFISCKNVLTKMDEHVGLADIFVELASDTRISMPKCFKLIHVRHPIFPRN